MAVTGSLGHIRARRAAGAPSGRVGVRTGIRRRRLGGRVVRVGRRRPCGRVAVGTGWRQPPRRAVTTAPSTPPITVTISPLLSTSSGPTARRSGVPSSRITCSGWRRNIPPRCASALPAWGRGRTRQARKGGEHAIRWERIRARVLPRRAATGRSGRSARSRRCHSTRDCHRERKRVILVHVGRGR